MASISPTHDLDAVKNETADSTTTSTTASALEQKSDSAENPETLDSLFTKTDDSKKQPITDSTEEATLTTKEMTPVKSSNTDPGSAICTTDVPSADDCKPKSENAIEPVSSVPESAASNASENAATVVDGDTVRCDAGEKKEKSDSHVEVIASDESAIKAAPSETAASADSAPLGTMADSVATEGKSPDVSLSEDKKNDTKGERIEGTGEEAKNNFGAETMGENAAIDDKEVSSDDADQFVDAKSTAQIDGTSGGDAESSGEAKEQQEVVQNEEEYEDDEEEQEAEPDDDEIEGNPAYIPKSGRYYMHDSRNTDEERATEQSSRSRADGKWKHDRFDERSQRPKTRRELMNRYGYDIRSEGNNNTGGSTNGPSPHTNRNRGAPRGGNRGGNRGGPYLNRAPPSQQQHQQQHQQVDRRDDRRQIQDNGTGRPAGRGGRRGESHPGGNNQREQPGTRVFKNSPGNAQRGTSSGVNRTDSHRPYGRGGDGQVRENRRSGGGRGGGGGPQPIHDRSAHTGGKRYSTQRLATNYVPEAQQPPPPTAAAPGPIPIPPPDWRPPPAAAFQGPPPTSAPPPPPPPPLAVPAPVPNFRSSDIVYFDPQPQQLYRNPIPPRAKKRLEIVPPYQAKNSN